ncbi:MAG: bifunctional 5,10-methylenetetrahydrofolate dehydrogenase/5,10-methenyltetrahydrofolate cyclohydrolase [bacterium]|nr:bifunctional 5,10-methylenetetrahydrofolate dehydrogenase/5,10-methenyltetrahydrofolate cyclohydrolase [bacterium]
MIIDGKQIAQEVLAELKKEISDKNLELSLGAILVGDDPEFKKFVELKGRAAERAGVNFTMYRFPENIETEELKKNMREISEWSDGVLVELPLPKSVDQQVILNEIPVEKDVDVLSDRAQDLFYENKSKINPPAVEALKIVLEKNHILPNGKKVAVFGQGILVGKPISHWLEQQGMEVFRIRSKTENPEKLSMGADIIISGVGRPDLVKGDMVRDGAIIIDFGYCKNVLGKMVGDVNFESVYQKASLITPVPGGMGPILIAAVLKNLIMLNAK